MRAFVADDYRDERRSRPLQGYWAVEITDPTLVDDDPEANNVGAKASS